MPDLSYLWKDPLFSKPVTGGKIRRMVAIGIAEMTGTGMFIAIGCASHAVSPQIASGAVFLEVVIAFVFGIGLAVLVTNHISGSVLNPGLSIALVILGHFSIYRCLWYTIFQLAGGALGVLWNYLLLPDIPANYCLSDRKPEVAVMAAFIYEILHSALLCWALGALVDRRRIKSIKHLAIKFMVILVPIILNITGIMGSNLNPAKAFGGAIIGLDFTEFWVFFAGPYIGCIVMAFVYQGIFHASIEEKAEAKNLPNPPDE